MSNQAACILQGIATKHKGNIMCQCGNFAMEENGRDKKMGGEVVI